MAVVATAYFGMMTLVVMPWLGKSSFGVWTASYIYKDLIPKGAQSISGVMATLISNPAYTFKTLVVADKLRYALQILVPLAFLPLRRGYLAVALIHGSLLTVLTTGYGPTIDIGFQYGANFIPYVFPASVLALEGMSAPPGGVGRQRAALVTMMLGTALCGVFWGAIPPREAIHGGFDTLPMTRPTPADQQKDEDLRALQALVPPDAWLAVSDHELPHLSRLNILSLKDTTDADYLLYAVEEASAANGPRRPCRPGSSGRSPNGRGSCCFNVRNLCHRGIPDPETPAPLGEISATRPPGTASGTRAPPRTRCPSSCTSPTRSPAAQSTSRSYDQ